PYHGATLLASACLRAHWPDVGGDTPGSYGTVTSILGEGIRLPPVRIVDAGVPVRDMQAVIMANVRTPDERMGDLNAQIAANRRACARLVFLAQKYGAATIRDVMRDILDYSERLMRLKLSALEDGESVFEDYCDGDGIIEDGEDGDQPFLIRMHVVKKGDRITVDFAGSSAKVAGPMNAP